MILSTDGVFTISKNHLKILHIVEDCNIHNKLSDMEILKNKSKVQNINCFLQDLIKLKFLKYEKPNYKLTISGMDTVAINALRDNGLTKLTCRIGIGKESDIWGGIYKGENVALKIHRLGRTSFKNVKNKRDYQKGKIDWYKINKLSCQREVEYYEIFKDLDIPRFIDSNRHIIVLELLDYQPLYMIKPKEPEIIYKKMIEFIKDLWDLGFVHGDFNEFNVLVKDGKIKVIDFPQCLVKTHKQATKYLKRDIECVESYFNKKHGLVTVSNNLKEILEIE
ncbi:serine/threonine-protein kinase (RIOK2) [Vairimorpha necatrix]|uniref:non-specific serine/threonine protein kinase n=1 Tax=Vairimorpha necatrix TaxID=6039 RepID=A0AAX4JEH4_9MICR